MPEDKGNNYLYLGNRKESRFPDSKPGVCSEICMLFPIPSSHR